MKKIFNALFCTLFLFTLLTMGNTAFAKEKNFDVSFLTGAELETLSSDIDAEENLECD